MKRYSTNNPLRRVGKKNVIAPILTKFVPENFDAIISLFFGTGSFEYNFVGKIKNLFANDLDSNVFNLYQVLNNNSDKLIEEIEMLPVGFDSWKYFKKYKTMELSNVEKAMFFLYYSNFGYMGKPDTLRFGLDNNKKQLLKNIKNFVKEISTNTKTEINYLNCNYNEVLNKINFRNEDVINKIFIFADPPYVETGNNYDTPEWTLENHKELQTYLINSKMKFMICEFDNKDVIEISKNNNLFITEIAERRNMKNKRTEIIITNYPTNINIQQKLF